MPVRRRVAGEVYFFRGGWGGGGLLPYMNLTPPPYWVRPYLLSFIYRYGSFTTSTGLFSYFLHFKYNKEMFHFATIPILGTSLQ